MAINPLQLPSSQAFTTDLNLGQSLAQLGQVYKQAQNQQRLSDLGKGLASGTIDYRTAAGQVADMGDVTHTLQFLALAEQQKKQGLEQAAAADFSKGLGGLYGGQPSAAPPTSNPMPVPGAPVNVPAATAPVALDRAPVMPSAKVWGDKEAEDAGIYEKPVQVASLAPSTANDAGGVPMPAARPPGAPGHVAQPAPAVVAQAAPIAPASPAAAPTGQPGAQHVPILLQALANPNLPAGQKETAKLLLTEAFKNMKDPEKIQTLKAMQADPSLAELEMKLKAAGKTEVNIDQKGETAFATSAGTSLGKRFEKLSEEGQTATQDLALVGQLRDLGAVVKTGAPAAIQGWLAERGVKVGDNVGAVEAYGSIIDKLTPQQRVPGSGATSDYEGRMFKNSLPKLINTPEGNEVISNTLAGLAQYKLDRAAIAEKALTREITPADALKQMRELPNPYQNFKDFTKAGFKADPNNPTSATPPAKTPDNVREVPMTKIEIDQSLANARAAVARNPAARDRIIQKLRENNIDPSGL